MEYRLRDKMPKTLSALSREQCQPALHSPQLLHMKPAHNLLPVINQLLLQHSDQRIMLLFSRDSTQHLQTRHSQCQEQADASCSGQHDGLGHQADQAAPHSCEADEDEDPALNEHCCKGLLVGKLHRVKTRR